ncbi:ABC transporter permease [Mangrovibacillus cuniculi]|uniref:ABC transporter permease n=1 Tax=Mangrovibacillus cuniculi TaxID=2593652 RepID=A0A7S8HG73_9BACI|nr:ABC transporter permease [Mangrovibacillus cuniculi]
MAGHSEQVLSQGSVPTTTNVQGKSKKKQTAWIGWVLPALLFLIWEAVGRLGLVPSYQLPPPSTILTTISEMATTGELWPHISATVIRVALGFAIGTVLATVLGAIVGYFKQTEQAVDPLIQGFRSIPSLAWVPLFILWLGIGESSKVLLIAVGVFFPVYLNVVSGIHSVDRKLLEVGKLYELSSLETIKRIILPAALPSFFVGLRSGLGLGWMFVVAAELMGASQGLGFLLVFGQNMSSPDIVIGSILLFAIIGKVTDALIQIVEKMSLKWQDSMRNV